MDHPGATSPCQGCPGAAWGCVWHSSARGEGSRPAAREGSLAPALHPLHRPGQKYIISSLRHADFENSILQANSPSLFLSLLCSLQFLSETALISQMEQSQLSAGCLLPSVPVPSARVSPSPRVPVGCFCCRPYRAVAIAYPCMSCSKKHCLVSTGAGRDCWGIQGWTLTPHCHCESLFSPAYVEVTQWCWCKPTELSHCCAGLYHSVPSSVLAVQN